MDAVGVGGGYRIGACTVHIGVNRKRRSIDREIAFDHIAVMVDPDQVGDLDLTEVNTERVYPEGIREFRVACSDMSCDAFIKSEF